MSLRPLYRCGPGWEGCAQSLTEEGPSMNIDSTSLGPGAVRADLSPGYALSPRTQGSGCFPGGGWHGPFGSGQHFRIFPNGFLCLRGQDCPRRLERQGPNGGHSKGSTIGPPSSCPGCPRGSGDFTGLLPATDGFAFICVFI